MMVNDASLLARLAERRAEQLRRTSFILVFGSALLLILSAVYTSFFLARSIGGSMRRLEQGTRRIAGGDLDTRIDVTGEDEISALAGSFNRMASDLKEIMASKADLERVIAERKRVEEELKESSGQRKLALDAAKLGWWSYNPITRIASWDERYKEIFGVTGYERANDEILAQIIHPEDLPGLWAKVEAALNPSAPEAFFAEYRINRPDGAVRWIEAYGIASFEAHAEGPRAVSFVGTVADITERKQAEERVQQYMENLRRANE
jgi:PAS domain S-box-containing protein